MMKVLRLSGIKLALGENEELLASKVAAILDIAIDDIVAIEIIRKAIDARRHRQPHFVYALRISVSEDAKLPTEFKEGFQSRETWNLPAPAGGGSTYRPRKINRRFRRFYQFIRRSFPS
jgi:uncharacterized FAD-dependent dehydrogenase